MKLGFGALSATFSSPQRHNREALSRRRRSFPGREV
jgi:hypothetical protein